MRLPRSGQITVFNGTPRSTTASRSYSLTSTSSGYRTRCLTTCEYFTWHSKRSLFSTGYDELMSSQLQSVVVRVTTPVEVHDSGLSKRNVYDPSGGHLQPAVPLECQSPPSLTSPVPSRSNTSPSTSRSARSSSPPSTTSPPSSSSLDPSTPVSSPATLSVPSLPLIYIVGKRGLVGGQSRGKERDDPERHQQLRLQQGLACPKPGEVLRFRLCTVSR